jgi:hypothetical protein
VRISRLVGILQVSLILSSGAAFAASESAMNATIQQESRVRFGAGVMPFVGVPPTTTWYALGVGFSVQASYQLGVNSNFMAGLGGGSVQGYTGAAGSSDKFNVVFVQPTLVYRKMSGHVHPVVALGVGPIFWDAQRFFSSSLRMGLDIDLYGPLSLSLEPVSVTVSFPNRLAWTPQLNLVATF